MFVYVQEMEKEQSLQVKWENYIVSLGNRPLLRCSELKALIRTGIPMEYRSKIWKTSVACLHSFENDMHLKKYLAVYFFEEIAYRQMHSIENSGLGIRFSLK